MTDFYAGTLSPRLLTVILRRLPADSETVRSVDPDRSLHAEWKTGDYLLAVLIDAFHRVNFKNPKPIPRPADVIRERERGEARRAALAEQADRVRRQLKGGAERG